MRNMKILLAAVAAACIGATASADFTAVGDPFEGNSWSQAFNESGVGYFDTIAIMMTSAGDSFETPSISGFSTAGWEVVWSKPKGDYPTFVVATGPAVTSLNFSITFAGSSSNSLEFQFMALLGDTELEYAEADWGPGWSIRGGNAACHDDMYNTIMMIPLPAPVALAGVGLLGVVFGRRRLRKIVGI